MMDLDNFKVINDTYGHATGDLALMTFSHLCMSHLRKYSLFGRLGGEEFGLCLQELNVDEGAAVAEKLRTMVEALEIPVTGGTLKFTVSIGVAEWRGEDSPEVLMARADKALYVAKQGGRNCVIVA